MEYFIEEYMKIAIISFVREGSVRIPKKNMKKFLGIPLLQYTLDIMNQLLMINYRQMLNHNNCYILTDFEEAKILTLKNKIKMIWRDHPKEWDDIRLNKWAHEKINADAYILLQTTSPLRDIMDLLKWIRICIETRINSAFSVFAIDRNNYKSNGCFYYYTKEQLETNKLVDNDSLLFVDKFDVDLDTEEDWFRAKKNIKIMG